MKKVRLLLLDANVVIELFALEVWKSLLTRCEVILTDIVKDEAAFYEKDGERVYIDLAEDIKNGDVQIVSVSAGEVAAFRARFKPSYADKLDDGETASLALLVKSSDYLICSADAIVFKVLACLDLSDQGRSLETLLRNIGLGKKMRKKEYTEEFRKQCTRQGQQDAIRGVALRM